MDGKKEPRDFPRWNSMVDMIKRRRAGGEQNERDRGPITSQTKERSSGDG